MNKSTYDAGAGDFKARVDKAMEAAVHAVMATGEVERAYPITARHDRTDNPQDDGSHLYGVSAVAHGREFWWEDKVEVWDDFIGFETVVARAIARQVRAYREGNPRWRESTERYVRAAAGFEGEVMKQRLEGTGPRQGDHAALMAVEPAPHAEAWQAQPDTPPPPPPPEQTLGAWRVGLDFNPTKERSVEEVKAAAAHLIDVIDKWLPAEYPDDSHKELIDEQLALHELAERRVEEGAMWAVKALTKRERA